MKPNLCLQRRNAARARAEARDPIRIEAVAGPTVYLSKRGDNVGRDYGKDGIVSQISLPRVKWLERGAPHS